MFVSGVLLSVLLRDVNGLVLSVLQGSRGHQGLPGLAGEAGAKGEKVQLEHSSATSALSHSDTADHSVCRETLEPVYQALLAYLVPLDSPSLAASR